jgi:chromosome segregation ATPase
MMEAAADVEEKAAAYRAALEAFRAAGKEIRAKIAALRTEQNVTGSALDKAENEYVDARDSFARIYGA